MTDVKSEKGIPEKFNLTDEASHEFRAMVNIIIGFAELMLDEVPGKINEQQRSSLTDILNSAKRLLNLLNRYEERSDNESGKTL